MLASGWTGAAPLAGSLDNRSLHMRVQFGCADASIFGRSCGGLQANTAGTPALGSTWVMQVSDAAANSLVFQRLGFDNAQPVYPFDLSGFGLPECYLFHDRIATNVVVADQDGNGSLSLNISNDPTSVGLKFYGQWINLNANAAGGLSFSEYVRVLIGR